MSIPQRAIWMLGTLVSAAIMSHAQAPTTWKGINYSPRQHSYWRMLYDWDAYNLGPVVNADLTTLSQAGFNVVHLYIWDTDVLSPLNDPGGFVDAGGDPSQSAHNQWQHLNDFVTIAENHGIYVILDFVSGWEKDRLNAPGAPDDTQTLDTTIITPYATWIGRFISYLCGSPNSHRNMLAWNDYWGLAPVAGATALTNPPPPGQTFSKYSYASAKLFQAVDQTSRQYSPYPGVLGLIGTAQLQVFTLPGGPHQVLRGSGYSFDWSAVQQNAATMHSLLMRLPPELTQTVKTLLTVR